MTDEKIEKYEQRLREIVRMPNSGEFFTREDGKKVDTGQQKRFYAYYALALDVGVSHMSTVPQKTANEAELYHVIRDLLQNESMKNISKAANSNVRIAAIAAVISAIAALVSLLTVVF